MQQDPSQQRNKQPEDGTKEDLNATNSDASLIRGRNTHNQMRQHFLIVLILK